MKKILFCLLIMPLYTFSQWQGTNPVYFNAGNVGIGTSSPSAKLNVYNSGPTQVIVGNPSTGSVGGLPHYCLELVLTQMAMGICKVYNLLGLHLETLF
jgi:hypothetical protein